MSKIIFMGLESSGKSLKMAMVVSDIAWRNHKWKIEQEKYLEEEGEEEFIKKYGRKEIRVRPIVSNMRFMEGFENTCKEYGIPIIYWEKLEEVIEYENADIIWDEVGNYLDATKWALLSSDVKKWLTQGAKVGIEIYGTSQDFAQVDKSFRRLTNELYEITKLMGSPRPSNTRPPIKRIWGICMVKSINPRAYKEDQKEIKADFLQLPSFFTIQKKYCDMFDTTQKIKRDNKIFLRHIQVHCSDPNCTFHAIKHV